MLRKLWAAPLAWIYELVVRIRHKLFDLNILKSEEFDIPIVCVGDLTVGGTGKTPVTEYLIEKLSPIFKVAVLSRGYKRKTRGFVLSTVQSSFRSIGDEPKQIKLKYPEIPVAVCEKRAEGIKKLREAHPEIELIILDDAFQHRYVEAWADIVLMDYNRPIYHDTFLPLGRLRDTPQQLDRADLVLVTKCPDSITPLDMRIVRKQLNLFPYQTLYFTKMVQGRPIPLFPEQAKRAVSAGDPVIIMTGIANPQSLEKNLSKYHKIVGKLYFRDHHTYRMRDLEQLKRLLADAPENCVVVVTEKDAVKLTNRKKIPVEIQRRLYYAPIRVEFIGNREIRFLNQLEQYARRNKKYSVLHPE